MERRFSYVVAFLAGCVLTTLAYSSGAVNRIVPASKETVVQALSKTPPATARPGADNNLVAAAAAKVESSVVDVHTQGRVMGGGNPFIQDPFLRRFFGVPGGGDEDNSGGSSGGGERIV